MEKIWLKNYPQQVPPEINPGVYASLVDMFAHSCSQFSQYPAFYNLGTTLTYYELDVYSRAFAAYLQQKLKLKKGDRIALMMPNILQYPVALFGALRAGLIVVNVNPLYTPAELQHQLQDSGAETIVVMSNFAHTVQAVLKQSPLKHIIVTELGDFFSWPKAWLIYFILKYIKRQIPRWRIRKAILFKTVLAQGKKLPLIPVEIHSTDIAFLQYTGGTTGISKGAMLTHRNLIANIEQAQAWFQPILHTGSEIIITALPLYHIFSLMANGLFIPAAGGLNVLITNPRDVPGLIREMAKFKFTVITGVNTLFNGLLKRPQFKRLDFSGLKLSLGGGAAIQQAVAEKWQKITGCPLLEAYGLTETSPCVTINPATLKTYNGTVGLPVSSTDVEIFDDAGHAVPIGEAGELAVKGPQVMLGYWNHPSETQKVLTPEGWLLTGDIAVINDQGYVRILERKKDMILVSGFNVYPNEIEDALVKMPGIREVAVVGVPDSHTGEAIKAYVVKDNPSLTVNDIVQFCRTVLTGYKIPKYIEFCKELPKTNVGKILRRVLRDEKVVEK